MPRLLLEDHLRMLHDELRDAVPERASDYAVLLQAADSLRVERQASVSDRTLGALEAGFRELLVGELEEDLRAGVLIGGAVADEQAGVQLAVESLVEWLTNPERFPARFLAAVEHTLREARRSAAESHHPEPGRP
jgi:hypothetical protein